MRTLLVLALIVLYCKTVGYAVVHKLPDDPNGNNVFIITLDGFRWQELFNGADSALISDKKFTDDTASLKSHYWDNNKERRRRKLMPFFWDFIAGNGQIFGNRSYNNNVNVSNLYALSYPGYNEIFTGRPDITIFSNSRQTNRNVTLLEYLNNAKAFTGKVAAFASWNMFAYILNKERSNLYIDCGNKVAAFPLDSACRLASLETSREDESIRNDYVTYNAAREYITRNHPKVVHIGLSGTDLYAHEKRYDEYLHQANLADNIIKWLWHFVQSSPFYKNRTTFVITTDHGRGAKPGNWHQHGFFTKGSSQTWLALLGNGVRNMGEIKQQVQIYQKQLAGTVGYLLNIKSYSNYTIPVSFLSHVNHSTIVPVQ